MATVSVPVFFREVLHSVCKQFSLDLPVYTLEQNEEGLFRTFVDVDYFDMDAEYQFITCLSDPYESTDQAEEAAAHQVLKKLRKVFPFEVKDYNFEEKKIFEDLYTRVSMDHSALRKKFKHFKSNYDLLWRNYMDLVSEKQQQIGEQKKFKSPSNVEELRQNISGTNLRNFPAVPPGFDK